MKPSWLYDAYELKHALKVRRPARLCSVSVITWASFRTRSGGTSPAGVSWSTGLRRQREEKQKITTVSFNPDHAVNAITGALYTCSCFHSL